MDDLLMKIRGKEITTRIVPGRRKQQLMKVKKRN
jgi:hypothetical protein